MYKAIHCGEIIATEDTLEKVENEALKAHFYRGFKYHVTIVAPSGRESNFFYGDETPSQFGPINVVREKKALYKALRERMKKLGLPVEGHNPKIN